jgi:hypothetical protein
MTLARRHVNGPDIERLALTGAEIPGAESACRVVRVQKAGIKADRSLASLPFFLSVMTLCNRRCWR